MLCTLCNGICSFYTIFNILFCFKKPFCAPCVCILFASCISIICIPRFPDDKVRFHCLKPRMIIFHHQIAHYVTKDVGELPITNEFPKLTVALEAHTVERTLVLILLPREYTATPTEFEEPIWGPVEDEVDESEGEEEK